MPNNDITQFAVTPNDVSENIEFNVDRAIVWGDIGGTLSNQTDLNTALGLKQDKADMDDYIVKDDAPGYADIETQTHASATYETKSTVTGINNRLTLVETDVTHLNQDVIDLDTGKQDKLTAGANITIVNNVISASGELGADWSNVTNKPLINNVNLASGNNTLANLGIASSSDLTTLSGRVDTAESDIVDLMTDKQDTLVSGTNIKTINNTSLLGSGDISITGGVWGQITGTLSNQTDLQTALNSKQDTLVSGTNIKTINSSSILGSGDITVSGLPSGGTNGDTLIKDSSASTGATWTSAQLIYTDDTTGGSAQSINADTLENYTVNGIMKMIYPVGSFFFNENNTNPSTWMSGTTWTLVGTRLTIDSRVYGSGKTFALTDNSHLVGFHFTHSTGFGAPTVAFGADVDGSYVSDNNTNLSLDRNLGVPTKAQIVAKGTGYEDATGLTTDYVTCYIWKRTA